MRVISQLALSVLTLITCHAQTSFCADQIICFALTEVVFPPSRFLAFACDQLQYCRRGWLVWHRDRLDVIINKLQTMPNRWWQDFGCHTETFSNKCLKVGPFNVMSTTVYVGGKFSFCFCFLAEQEIFRFINCASGVSEVECTD